MLLSPTKSTACAGVAPASPSSGDLSHHGLCCSAVFRGPKRWGAHIPSCAHRACSGPAVPSGKMHSSVTYPVSEVGLSVLPVPRQSSTLVCRQHQALEQSAVTVCEHDTRVSSPSGTGHVPLCPVHLHPTLCFLRSCTFSHNLTLLNLLQLFSHLAHF